MHIPTSYLQVDATTEKLTSFELARILLETSQRGRIDEVVEISAQGKEVGVVSPGFRSSGQKDMALSPCWHANPLWGVDHTGRDCAVSAELVGATERVVCDHGGVCSADAVLDVTAGDRSWEGLEFVHTPVSVVLEGSLRGCREAWSESRRECHFISAVTILGSNGAAVAPVLGSTQGGPRKVKLVNYLVEALGSPTEQCATNAARTRRGRGCPTKVRCPVDASGDVVNVSLTDSYIQAR
ncbi:hypothetical protein V6N12_046887 [Hibiscus sabdariffa]|uniref:Uncharacterized protein n=1 Tax=Hibiscus sabdariffa TaxID=183260 RepID=A0ABR2AXJ2_9ROSI